MKAARNGWKAACWRLALLAGPLVLAVSVAAFPAAPAQAASKSLTISPAALPSGVAGQPYSATLTASGGKAPYTWSISTGGLPAGLSLSTSGDIVGTPTAAGTSSIKVKVTDSSSPVLSGTKKYTVRVTLGVSPATLPSGVVGQPYSESLTATGGTAPYTWTILSGALPTGLALSSGGAISGTPTKAAKSSVKVKVTDSTTPNALTATATYSVVVVIGVAPSTLPDGTVGSAYSQALTASGGKAPYTWNVTGGSLPAGLELSSAGEVSGTPTTAGTLSVTIGVTDSSSPAKTGSVTYAITVGNPLAVATQTLSDAWLGSAYSVQLVASGGQGSITWQITSGQLPPGLSLSSGGLLSGIPTAFGTSRFGVEASDSSIPPNTASADLSLSVTSSELTAGQSLTAGESLTSPSNLYHADMQSDGNFVVYPAGDNSSTGGAIWNSQTEGNPGDYVTLQTDGNLVIYPAGDNSTTGGALWNAGTEGNTNVTLTMQDDGNLVVYSSSGQALWSSMYGKSGGGYTGYPWLSASCVTGNNSECDTSSGPYAFDWGYTACPPSDTECMGYGQTITYDGTKWGMSDPWGYDLRNCTSYVAWYLVDEEGISASKVEGLGNAAQWEPNAHDEGVATGTARVGAVAWWNSNYGGGYGHVAIVTQVNSNGTVNTADYNQQETGEYGTETDQSPSGYIDF
jgi:hypothetical protein